MNKEREIISSDKTGALIAWIRDIVRQLRLAWRLFLDRRVPFWNKLIPPVTLAYVLSPIDILSDVPPVGLNQLDDVAVVLLGVKLFIELAPPELVREHLRDLGARVEEWRVVGEEADAGSVIEGSYTVESVREAESEESVKA